MNATSSKFELEYLLWLKFILHEYPIHNPPIRTDRIEVKLLTNIWIPPDFPDWVNMFLYPYCALINRPFVLIPDIENQNSSIIQPDCQESC